MLTRNLLWQMIDHSSLSTFRTISYSLRSTLTLVLARGRGSKIEGKKKEVKRGGEKAVGKMANTLYFNYGWSLYCYDIFTIFFKMINLFCSLLCRSIIFYIKFSFYFSKQVWTKNYRVIGICIKKYVNAKCQDN